MYTLYPSQEFIDRCVFLKSDQNYPSINNKIKTLSESPLEVAIETKIPLFCDYYVNAGRHAILFDVDETNEAVYLRVLMNRPKLDKILTGKIKTD